MAMCNSLTLSAEEVAQKLADDVPHVIRIRMPEDETVGFEDMVRGAVQFQTGTVDDKVLLKADGMPTYHLAVVVDDYLMGITHAFRGEEWLPSAPVHLLLWKYLGWEAQMPQWAHLPLILKPDGHGKLSKRDGDRLGFPVFAMNWKDPKSGELTRGFREMGFLPEAFVNLLALLGWNDGSGKEIMTIDELCSGFSMERIHKGGARFDFEKAKWFNQEWIKRADTERLLPDVLAQLETADIRPDQEILKQVIPMVKERCVLLTDFVEQTGYFFRAPLTWDLDAVRPKWTPEKQQWFNQWAASLGTLSAWDAPTIEADFKGAAANGGIKPGELQLPFRVMLVGGKFGPPVFEIASLVGREQTIARIKAMLAALKSND